MRAWIVWDSWNGKFISGPHGNEIEAEADAERRLSGSNQKVDLQIVEVPVRWVGSSGRTESERADLLASNRARGRAV